MHLSPWPKLSTLFNMDAAKKAERKRLDAEMQRRRKDHNASVRTIYNAWGSKSEQFPHLPPLPPRRQSLVTAWEKQQQEQDSRLDNLEQSVADTKNIFLKFREETSSALQKKPSPPTNHDISLQINALDKIVEQLKQMITEPVKKLPPDTSKPTMCYFCHRAQAACGGNDHGDSGSVGVPGDISSFSSCHRRINPFRSLSREPNRRRDPKFRRHKPAVITVTLDSLCCNYLSHIWKKLNGNSVLTIEAKCFGRMPDFDEKGNEQGEVMVMMPESPQEIVTLNRTISFTFSSRTELAELLNSYQSENHEPMVCFKMTETGRHQQNRHRIGTAKLAILRSLQTFQDPYKVILKIRNHKDGNVVGGLMVSAHALDALKEAV